MVFRGSVQFQNRVSLFLPDERENCVFVADDSGVHVVAAQDEDSGAGLPFLGFRVERAVSSLDEPGLVPGPECMVIRARPV